MAELERSDAEGQIKILLEEYRSLRDEAKQRISERMTLLSLAVAAAALIASSHNAVWAYAVAAGFLVGAAWVWLRSWRILDKLSRRLSGLEQAINGLARRTYSISQECEPLGPGSNLLGWETQLQTGRDELAEAGGLKGMYGQLVHPKPKQQQQQKKDLS